MVCATGVAAPPLCGSRGGGAAAAAGGRAGGWRPGRGERPRPAVSPARGVRAVRAQIPGGGESPEGPGWARFGGAGPRYCARSVGARLTSLPAGGAAGRAGRKASTMRPRGAREGGRGGAAGGSPPPACPLLGVHVGSACAALFFVRVLEPSSGLPLSVMSPDCVTNARPVSSSWWSNWRLMRRLKRLLQPGTRKWRAVLSLATQGLVARPPESGVVCCRRRQKRAERRRQKARS